jgi:hypothetical protein
MGIELQHISRACRKLAVGILPLGALLTSSFSVRASDLLDVALSSLPSETLRLEYVNLERLRRRPDFESLQRRYVGPRLEILGTTLAKLGVREDDIDEIVMAWLPGTKEKGFAGFATGRFSSSATLDHAAVTGLTPTPVEGQELFCQETKWMEACVAVLDSSLGAFGTRASLTQMLRVRAGRGTGLTENPRFMHLVDEGQGRASIWGVAMKPEVVEWFNGWLEGRGAGQIDWSVLVQDVEVLAYRVDADEAIRLQLKMDCSTPEAADRLRDVLEVVKVVLPLAWQSQNPGLPNPVRNLDVSLSGTRVAIELSADSQGLRAAEQILR